MQTETEIDAATEIAGAAEIAGIGGDAEGVESTESTIVPFTVGEGASAITYLVDAETGEMVGDPLLDLPAEILADGRRVADEIGPRLLAARARLAGLMAARDAETAVVLAPIKRKYDADIRREQRVVSYLSTNPAFAQPLVDLARTLLMGQKAASIVVGLLTLRRKAMPERVDITNESVAITFLRSVHPEAVVEKPSIAKKAIGGDLRFLISEEGETETGMVFWPRRDEYGYE